MARTKQLRVRQPQATRTQADIDRFLRLAEKIKQGIKSGIFYPNDNYICGIYGYAEMCEKW